MIIVVTNIVTRRTIKNEIIVYRHLFRKGKVGTLYDSLEKGK